MSDVVIRVENLGKLYRIGQHEPYLALRDSLTRAMSLPLRALSSVLNGHRTAKSEHPGPASDLLWALRNVSFEVKRGEVVGIIGRNGSGKSTLLKVLSRITEPTEGRAEVRGRVGSLLEVGTGFHPELTGRENVYLNGAILGMKKAQIDRKFDEIVAFAEIERFMDTPVKRYSSGMYVRLAFAVAAHLEPEVLLVDEVLAVGDFEFQRKCLGKMDDVAKEGRTVLFVSHNLGAIRQLCTTALLLDSGRIVKVGQVDQVVAAYFGSAEITDTSADLTHWPLRSGSQEVAFTYAQLVTGEGRATRTLSIGDTLGISFTVRPLMEGRRTCLAIHLRTQDGVQLCHMMDRDSGFGISQLTEPMTFITYLEDIRFYPGRYFVSLWAGSPGGEATYDFVPDCLSFDITDGGALTARSLPREAGFLFLTPRWVSVPAREST